MFAKPAMRCRRQSLDTPPIARGRNSPKPSRGVNPIGVSISRAATRTVGTAATKIKSPPPADDPDPVQRAGREPTIPGIAELLRVNRPLASGPGC